ncbi:hypothetical protein ACP4OV_026511 [Aristida adscensionis]
MDPPNPNLDISESMVRIDISSYSSPEFGFSHTGIVVDCNKDSAFIVADARAFEGILNDQDTQITISSLNGGVLLHDKYDIQNGLIGIILLSSLKDPDTMNALKKIKICVRPLKICEAVYVYEGINRRLTPGNITIISGRQFSHNCALAALAEFGAPVINKDGEMDEPDSTIVK